MTTEDNCKHDWGGCHGFDPTCTKCGCSRSEVE